MRIVPLCLLLLAATAFANESAMPTKLFGIELGTHYEMDEDYLLAGAPINKVTNVHRAHYFNRIGILYYFEPNKKYDGYEYLEWHDDSPYESPYEILPGFQTSFRLFLLPVITDPTHYLDASSPQENKWEVVGIRWSSIPAIYAFSSETNAQQVKRIAAKDWQGWARSLCKSVEVDLDIENSPSFDGADVCEFEEDDRVLKILFFHDRGGDFELEYSGVILSAKHDELEKLIRKAQMERSRPYD